MAGQEPTVMVSSTYFDLREIRQQLHGFIERDLGCRALISESPSFPVDPDVNTIENCRRRVEQEADLLVLVIGNRYGSIERQSGKSVTNLEYLAARAKGIPVYAFVEKRSLVLLDAWRAANENDRSVLGATVEDARLFEFIERVRSKDSVWIHEFETAAEITAALRRQFAFLMQRGLTIQTRLARRPDRELLDSLSPRAFRLAVEEPKGWEWLLFAEVLADEVAALHTLRREYDLHLLYGAEHVSVSEVADWAQTRLAEIMRFTESASKLLNESAMEAFGPSGTSGNAKEIVFVARQVARIYEESLRWAQRVRSVRPPGDVWEPLFDILATFSEDLIKKIEPLGPQMREQVRAAIDASALRAPGDPPITIGLEITFEPPRSEELIAAMTAAYASIGVGR